MKAIEFDRNGPLREALASGSGCPPLAQLVEAALAGGTTPEAAALLAHAAQCAACGAELALVRAFDSTPRNAAEAEEIAWVARQATTALPTGQVADGQMAARTSPQMGRVLTMDRARARRPKETPLWHRWAAAALIVVGLGFMFEWAHRTIGGAPGLPDAPASDVVRSGEVLLEAPVGVLGTAPAEFSWRAVAGAASYRVELRDVAGDLVWQGSSSTTRLAIPADPAAQLQTLVTYRWNVTAFDTAASALAHSAPASFRIEPPAN